MSNEKMRLAKNTKNDEFYTRFDDIAEEMENYKEFLSGKIIYCNCDNPEFSNFWRYFHLNFKKLGLKKIIATYFNEKGKSYCIEYLGGNDNNIKDGIITELQGNGDFQSNECIEILKQADVIITNPPFSLFRNFFKLLIKYDKKFLVIANQNMIFYKDVVQYVLNNKIWYGATKRSGSFEFATPKGIVELGVTRWFTNIDYSGKYKGIVLTEKYNPLKYPKYDNYDAIEVSKTKDIPCDYDGIMGVPITFFEKYNSEQFEILDSKGDLFLTQNGTRIKVYQRFIIRKNKNFKKILQ